MANQYEVFSVQTQKQGFCELTTEQFFEVFRSGKIQNIPLVWIQPAGDESKRVTFAENVVAQP